MSARARWLCWLLWNRTRWYWPQAQTRRQAQQTMREFYARHGETWRPRKHWLLPW